MVWKKREKAQNYRCMKPGAEAAGICAQVGFRAGVREAVEETHSREFSGVKLNVTECFSTGSCATNRTEELVLFVSTKVFSPGSTSLPDQPQESSSVISYKDARSLSPCYRSSFQIVFISYRTSLKYGSSTLFQNPSILGI